MGNIAGRINMLFTYQPPSLTGMYDKPTLSVHPGAEVISGENVTFYCRLETATSTFFLIKEGRSSRPQHKYGNIQADFYMGPVTTAHRGTYRCFGSYNNHLWSFPSEPVMLLVTGEETPNFLHFLSGTPSESQSVMRDKWEDVERIRPTDALVPIQFLETLLIVHEEEHQREREKETE